MDAIYELQKILEPFCVGVAEIDTASRHNYDVYDNENYINRGVSYVVIDIDITVNPYTGEEETTGCIVEYNDRLEPHGQTYSVLTLAFGLCVTYVSYYVNGALHNPRGLARHTTDMGNSDYNGYYMNGIRVTREMLEDKQRAAITNLLPQPIWEEVLEHYAIEVYPN